MALRKLSSYGEVSRCSYLLYAYEDVDAYYMCMPLVMAGSLRWHVRDGPLPKSRVRDVAIDLATALCYLHHLKIVHCDIKPENVLMKNDGSACLTDFGLAAFLENGQKLRGRRGTLGYWSPEVQDGKEFAYDADWWSYGVTLWRVFHGKKPFNTLGGRVLYEPLKKPSKGVFVWKLMRVKRSKRWIPSESPSTLWKTRFFGEVVKDPWLARTASWKPRGGAVEHVIGAQNQVSSSTLEYVGSEMEERVCVSAYVHQKYHEESLVKLIESEKQYAPPACSNACLVL